MLSRWSRASKALLRGSSHSSQTRAPLSRSRVPKPSRSFITSAYASTSETPSFLHFLALFGAGAVVSSAIYVTGSDESVAQAETEESAPTAIASPIITNLTKDSAYIVGSSVMTGKLDDDAMLVPHQV